MILGIQNLITGPRPSYAAGFARNAAESEYPNLWKELVGLWAPSLGPTGLTLFDHAGWHNHGTLTNMDPATAWVPSPYGWAARFTAAKSEIRLQNTAGINQAVGSFVLAYTRRATGENFSGLFGIDIIGGIGGADKMRCYDSGSILGFSFFPNHSDAPTRRWEYFPHVTSADINQFVLNQRYTVAATWDDAADEIRGYLDGVPSGTENGSGTWSPAGGWPGGEVLVIGNTLPGHATLELQCAGDIEYIIFWDRVLRPSEMQDFHTNPLALLQPLSWIIFGEVEVEPEPPEVFLHDGRHNRIASIMSRMQATQRFRRIVRMPLDLSGDFAVIDGKVSIILAGDVINDVVMLQSKQKEGDPSEGAYLHRETTFQVPTTGDLDPKVGDTVAVSGVSYRILDVRQPFLGDYWGLKTREVSITADTDLQDLITLFPAVHRTDVYGSKRTTHPAASDTFASVPGKVQPQSISQGRATAATEELGAKRGFRKIYAIYVSAELPTLKRGDLLKDQNSKQYTIESWTNRQRIDELSVIVCSTPPGS